MGIIKRKTGAKKASPKKAVGKLRRGQFISTSGCGAIVDMAKESVLMAGTDYWTQKPADDCLVFEENLQMYLGVEHFVSPSAKKENEEGHEANDLPAFRFPTWVFCSGCKRLAELTTFRFRDNPKCATCEKPLIPSRFVVACEHGHLDDFPYEWWVHEAQGKKRCARPELTIETDEKRSGLDSILIRCRCGFSRTMGGSFGKEVLKKCTGRAPWLGMTTYEECSKTMRTLQRGATNLYFPITASALSIPPWSKRVQQELNKRWSSYRRYIVQLSKESFMDLVKADGLPEICKCTAEEIFQQAMLKAEYLQKEVVKTLKILLQDEYRAFDNEESDDDGEFQVRKAEVPDFLYPFVEKIVLADKLREVLALRGFTRIEPKYKETDPSSYRTLSKDPLNWLPGIELLGEGIFIQLREDAVLAWEKEHGARYEQMAKEMEGSLVQKENFSPRYVLLHSLAHLLIRQLILQCGYSSSAIKERIYSTFPGEDSVPMAGLLIYTASNDSEGSLGGLVREGEVDRFDNSFRLMLESASWCSSDPLCIHSKGQGLDSLNMAACHSCALLPETSCESRNSFLDRAAVVGTLEQPQIGFFHSILKMEGL